MHAWRFALTGALMVAASAAMAQDRTQARSMVISQYGIVAAEHPIAARAGAAMLESGGNAIDAAVAANAAMGLVAPMMSGIGGDLFAIVYDAKTKQVYGLNASGWAPKALTPAFLVTNGARRDALRGHPFRDCAGRGRWLGCAAAPLRYQELCRCARSGDRACQGGVPGQRAVRRRLGRQRRLSPRQCRGDADLPAGASRSRGRRNLPQPRSRGLTRRDRQGRQRRLLQGRDRAAHSCDLGAARRHHGRRRSRRLRRGMGRSDRDRLPRLDGL